MTAPSPNLKRARLAFELWDNESGNLIGAYETEEEALVDINETICAYGAGYANSVALLLVGPRGGMRRLAVGSDLAKRARKASAETARRAAIDAQPQGSPRVLLERPER